MLLSGGRPAQTLYFSTSNGRTYGNEEVFGSDPLPYLRPVPERDDGDSPIAGVRIDLYDNTGALVATTYTDANGYYKFNMLRPGEYTVIETQPQGYFDGGAKPGTGGGVGTGGSMDPNDPDCGCGGDPSLRRPGRGSA